MKLLLTGNLIFLLLSCGLPEVVKKSQEIGDDLVSAFRHKDIATSVHWGTEEKNNRVSVVFCKYELGNKCYTELQHLATRVKERVLNKNPDVSEMHLIEVTFTEEEDTDDLQNVVTFQFRNLTSQSNTGNK